MSIQETGLVEIACLNGARGEKEELKEGKA